MLSRPQSEGLLRQLLHDKEKVKEIENRCEYLAQLVAHLQCGLVERLWPLVMRSNRNHLAASPKTENLDRVALQRMLKKLEVRCLQLLDTKSVPQKHWNSQIWGTKRSSNPSQAPGLLLSNPQHSARMCSIFWINHCKEGVWGFFPEAKAPVGTIETKVRW